MSLIEKYINENGESYIKSLAYKSFNNYLYEYKSSIDYDDFYQICLINLYKDLEKNYDSSRASITTYIFQRIPNYAYTELRRFKAKKRIPSNDIISIEQEINDCDNIKYSDFLSYDINSNPNIMDLIDKFISYIDNVENKKIFKLYLTGYSLTEIGQIMNLKKSVVNSRIQYIKNKFKDGKFKYE